MKSVQHGRVSPEVPEGARVRYSKGRHAQVVRKTELAKVVLAESKVHVQGIGPRTMVRQGQTTVQQARVRAKVS